MQRPFSQLGYRWTASHYLDKHVYSAVHFSRYAATSSSTFLRVSQLALCATHLYQIQLIIPVLTTRMALFAPFPTHVNNMKVLTGGICNSPHFSLECNISSSSDSLRFLRSISSWKSFQEVLHAVNTTNKAKVSKLIRQIRKLLNKLRKCALRLVRLGMFQASPEEALFWLFEIIVEHFPVNSSWFFDSEDWETSTDFSLDQFSCGSWSSFWHRSESGVAPPPPPHGNYFMRSWSRKSTRCNSTLDQESLFDSVFDMKSDELDKEGGR